MASETQRCNNERRPAFTKQLAQMPNQALMDIPPFSVMKLRFDKDSAADANSCFHNISLAGFHDMLPGHAAP